MGNGSNSTNILELSYSFGLGGGSSRAATGSLNPVRAWEPSQNGLLADWPHRQSEITVRPARPNVSAGGIQDLEFAFNPDGPVIQDSNFSWHHKGW